MEFLIWICKKVDNEVRYNILWIGFYSFSTAEEN